MTFDPDHYIALSRQALRRDLTPAEMSLADAIEAAFRADAHEPAAVAQALNEAGLAHPSGLAGGWTAKTLVDELTAINASLDEAYRSAATPLHRYA